MQTQSVDDLVQGFLEIVQDDAILPEVALVAAAESITRLAAIARKQQKELEALKHF